MIANYLKSCLAAAALITALPATASAYDTHQHTYAQQRAHDRYERARYEREHRQDRCAHRATNGTIIGAVGGGVVGNLIGHHSLGGTLVGAGVGAVAGHEIAKSHCR